MKLDKLEKVNDSFTINRYDNGFMVEVSGKDSDSEWKTSKVLCNDLEDLLVLVTEYTNLELDN